MVAATAEKLFGQRRIGVGCQNRLSIFRTSNSSMRNTSVVIHELIDRCDRLDEVLKEAVPGWVLGPLVHALQALRGVKLTATCLVLVVAW